MAALPEKIGQFEVLRQIGSGGMGAVYLGRDPELDRQVAIKVIREEVHDQEVLDRFFREARAAAALRHPNIITIYASGQHQHQPYMVMEFVDGESLAEIIRKKRSLTLADRLSYLEQICAGLHFAHRAGIVHRDVKPANVMVDRHGIVRILDFGIARIEGSAMTQDGALMGSLNYMSPEQMLGRPIDHRSDIFSVGSLAYELVSYQQAFKGGLNDGLLQRLPHEDPPPLHEVAPDIPWALEEIIMRALQKAPENRFKDLAEMRSALLAVQQGAPAPLPPAADDRTMVIPREALARDDSGVFPAAAAPPSSPTPLWSQMDPAPVAPPPPPAPPPVVGPATGTGWMPDTAARPEPTAPGTQTWQAKKKAAQPAASPARTSAGTTVRKVATTRPATIRPQAPPPRASSHKWVVGGVAAALLVGAAAAIPWLTAPPVSVLERERPGIEASLERYRIGYRNRELSAVTAAFPRLPQEMRQAMQRTFANCLVYEVTFDRVQVQMTPDNEALAEIALRSTHTCTPQSGERQTSTGYDETFTLRKNGETWVIESANRAQ
ncbi:MAG: serine/threonine protein kinase [Acidobacteria bacterium]|nr:serine/threonine protein kinase [Acidobacteriota bacterium]